MKWDREIIDYITIHKGCTYNAVRKYMSEKGFLSTTTTNNRIKKLIESSELEDKKVGNSFHRLYVTDKTAYNRIRKELVTIEKFADRIYEPLQQLDHRESNNQDSWALTTKYMKTFVMPYFTSMYSMLYRLHDLSDGDEVSRHDTIELHKMIFSLTEKIRKQPQVEPTATELKRNKQILQKQFQNHPEIHDLNDNIVNDLVILIEDFEKQFLTTV